MDCERLEAYLNLYVDGALSEEQLRELEAHAAKCEACGRQYAAARQLKSMLSEMPEELDVPLPTQAKWREAVKAEAVKARMRRIYRYAGGIAAALLVLIGVGLVLRPGAPDAAQRVTSSYDSVDSLEATKDYEAAEDSLMRSAGLMMVESDGASLEKSTAAPESASIADAAPMREISLKVADLDEACDYFHDLIEEYEGTLDEQRFDSDGQLCANLFVEIPGCNVAEFTAAAAQYAHSDEKGAGFTETMEDNGAVSMLLVLRSE